MVYSSMQKGPITFTTNVSLDSSPFVLRNINLFLLILDLYKMSYDKLFFYVQQIVRTSL